MTPLVSVLIPVYNAERWVAQTLESALSQTWPRLEIIAVNDGSKDGSLPILRQFEQRGVKVIDQPNGGAGQCRNRALQESTGDFIQYLDADDLLSPRKIEEQVKVLQHNPAGAVGVSSIVYFFDGDNPQHGNLHDTWPIVDSDDPLTWLVELLGPDGGGGMIQTGQWLVPRAVAEAAGPWDEHPSPDDDGEYFARVVLSSAGLRRCPKEVCYYRKFRTAGSLSTDRSEVHQRGLLRSTESKATQILSRTQGERAKRALARHYMMRAFDAYPAYPQIVESALQRAAELGGDESLLHFGSRNSRIINRLFGWRCARRASLWLHRYVPSPR